MEGTLGWGFRMLGLVLAHTVNLQKTRVFQLHVLIWKVKELDWVSLKILPNSRILCITDSKMTQRLQACVVGRTSFHWQKGHPFVNGNTLIGKMVVVFLDGKSMFPALYKTIIPHAPCYSPDSQNHQKHLSKPPHLLTFHFPATAPHSNPELPVLCQYHTE